MGLPVQVPSVVVNVSPTFAVPVTAGATVFVGATAGEAMPAL